MHGYLIIQIIVQIMDVINQIQIHGDIGQAHHINVIHLLMLGTSVELAT